MRSRLSGGRICEHKSSAWNSCWCKRVLEGSIVEASASDAKYLINTGKAILAPEKKTRQRKKALTPRCLKT